MWKHQVEHTGVARFQFTRFSNSHEIPLPPLRRQAAIGEILDSLDGKIVVNESIAASYEALLSVDFDDLRIDVDPDSQHSMSASELIDFNPAMPSPARTGSVYLDMAAVPTDSARVRQWAWREPKSGTRFTNGCTVMARITPCLENGKVAFIDFMAEGEVGVGSTEFIVMRSRHGIPAHVSYFLARSPRFRDHAIRNMVGSSGRQRVNASNLANFPLAQPDDDKLAAFGEAARVAFDYLKSLGRESVELARLREVLLPKLMTGEIRVRDAGKAVEEAT